MNPKILTLEVSFLACLPGHRPKGYDAANGGISQDAWKTAQQKLGPMVSAAAMSLIYEKSATGEVALAVEYLQFHFFTETCITYIL